ncbi:sulfurtransferase [Roseibium alexandrii]|uniref:Sulfurtransferase n=1 Tax=Roseibium alexandrii (strain DSM 17067 / NCIMB 14079 / DFL-11) TaxID=244592 RepID=A0A5E8GWR9_ROSAD|nr:sulfurtransferase [Roseibium alexandrii]EEE43779.1 Rhodanese-related sulfurtransferase [Roseibium alexandrii DFL-11]
MTALVETDWLAEHTADPNVCVIEIDWDGLTDYEAGHIPGCLGWHWKSILWDPFEREFPTDKEWAQRLGDAGISQDTTVVLYGAPVQFGTYAWWVFKLFGHTDVRILNGGKVKWVNEGRPLSTDMPIGTPVAYGSPKRNESARVGRQKVLESIDNPNCVILDHRSGEEYLGQRVGLPGKPDVGAERYGRIPGARHVPFDALINEDTSFKSADELQKIIGTHVTSKDMPVISYCRLAHRATLASFAMTELLGYSNVRVYDGSWTEWGSMVGVPIER